MADEKKEVSTTEVHETKDGKIEVKHRPGKGRKPVTLHLDPDDLVREKVSGFTNFLREYAVVGLAVGFIVGQQANAVVKQLVASFVNPWVAILFGEDLNSRVAHLHHGRTLVKLPWGAFVYTLIEFFLVLISIYIVIKLFRLDKLKKTDK